MSRTIILVWAAVALLAICIPSGILYGFSFDLYIAMGVIVTVALGLTLYEIFRKK